MSRPSSVPITMPPRVKPGDDVSAAWANSLREAVWRLAMRGSPDSPKPRSRNAPNPFDVSLITIPAGRRKRNIPLPFHPSRATRLPFFNSRMASPKSMPVFAFSMVCILFGVILGVSKEVRYAAMLGAWNLLACALRCHRFRRSCRSSGGRCGKGPDKRCGCQQTRGCRILARRAAWRQKPECPRSSAGRAIPQPTAFCIPCRHPGGHHGRSGGSRAAVHCHL